MQKVYAKNPGEIILDNPDKKKKKLTSKKDPARVAAGKKAWRTRQRKNKQQKGKKTMSRTNPEKLAKTGKDMFVRYGLAAVGTITSLKLVAYAVDRFGGKLPAAVREYAPIAVPAAAGIIIGSKAKKSNELIQGVAGGMMYASVSQALHKFLPSGVTNSGLSDGIGYKTSSFLADGSMVVTPEGLVMDQNGNILGQADFSALNDAKSSGASATPKLGPGKSRQSNPDPMTKNEGSSFGTTWETQGETYGVI